jgi:hypothetical protein
VVRWSDLIVMSAIGVKRTSSFLAMTRMTQLGQKVSAISANKTAAIGAG